MKEACFRLGPSAACYGSGVPKTGEKTAQLIRARRFCKKRDAAALDRTGPAAGVAR